MRGSLVRGCNDDDFDIRARTVGSPAASRGALLPLSVGDGRVAFELCALRPDAHQKSE